MDAGWHSDPDGRHDLRYHDGSSWTEHVSDAGQQSIDQLIGDSASAATDLWEYTAKYQHEWRQKGLLGGGAMVRDFNKLGAQGWELVGIYEERAVFKRRVTRAQNDERPRR